MAVVKVGADGKAPAGLKQGDSVITNGGTIRFDWLQYWWMWLPCAIMLILFVLSINFIGDGLRDASDPTQIG